MPKSWKEPTLERYVAAFTSIRQKITPPEWRMLEAHFLAEGQSITFSDLARAAGYRTRNPAIPVYSRLGKKLGEELGKPRNRDLPTKSFVEFTKTADKRFWIFSMRRHAVQALSILGWFDDSEFDGASDFSLQIKVAREGKLTIRLRKHRHREQSLRRAKLRDALARDGRLLCEVPRCGFDFAARYGSLGEAFAEVHHLIALSTHD